MLRRSRPPCSRRSSWTCSPGWPGAPRWPPAGAARPGAVPVQVGRRAGGGLVRGLHRDDRDRHRQHQVRRRARLRRPRTWRPTSSSSTPRATTPARTSRASSPRPRSWRRRQQQADAIAAQLHAPAPLELDLAVSAERGRSRASPRRTMYGTIIALHDHEQRGLLWVATPALLKAFGISPSELNPAADVLTARAMLPSSGSLILVSGSYLARRRTPRLPGRDCASRTPCPGGEQAAVRHLGAEHGHHRGRGQGAARDGGPGRLAHPGPHRPHRGADQRGPAGRARASAPPSRPSPGSSASARSATAPPSAACCWSRSACSR